MSARTRIGVREIRGLQSSTLAYRYMLAAALLLLFLWEDKVHRRICSLWTSCLQASWFRHDSFEVLFSTACFSLWISMFWLADHRFPSLRSYRFNVIESKNSVPVGDDKLHWDELISWHGRWRAAGQEVVWYGYFFLVVSGRMSWLRHLQALSALSLILDAICCSMACPV